MALNLLANRAPFAKESPVFCKSLPLTRLLCAALLLLPSLLQAETRLTQEEVQQIFAQATTRAAQLSQGAVIAVVDREGFLLGLWDVGGNLPRTLVPFSFALPENVLHQYGIAGAAITRAMTAAFLSSDQNAFTTRTAGFIIQQHFPPGIRNTGTGPLVGVGLSSLFFSDVQTVKLIPPGFNGALRVDPTVSPGSPIGRAPDVHDPGVPGRGGVFPLASLNDSPGGVPLYKDGHLVGGVGVTGDGGPTNLTPAAAIFLKQTQKTATSGFKTGYDRDEEIALAGQSKFRPNKLILGSNSLINGIRIPYVYQDPDAIRDVVDVQELGSTGNPVDIPIPLTTLVQPGFPQASPAGYPYQIAKFGDYDGEIRFPLRDDPLMHVKGREKINGAARLSRQDVEDIISVAADRARKTRAGIRLPIGTQMKVFISVVSNPAKAGERPEILGVFRTGEATIFSWDVAVQKARTAVFFSNRQLAMSARSVGFLSQRYYPPGLDGRPHGPLFGFQEAVSLRQRPLADQKKGAFPFPGNPNLPNGITIFPGGFPLYRNGQLIGAIGVSGDGVDQDDLVAASGCQNFLAPRNIRADTYSYRGARLPYAKFPRDPEQ
jgi:uncharacterized protein GlcG (DUF336 family)